MESILGYFNVLIVPETDNADSLRLFKVSRQELDQLIGILDAHSGFHLEVYSYDGEEL